MSNGMLLSWIRSLLARAWRRVRTHIDMPSANAENRITFWAVWVQASGAEATLVAFVEGTHEAAHDVGQDAIGAHVWRTGRIFVGRCRVEEVDLADEELLKTALSAAVPLHIAELRRRPWSELQERAAVAAQVVAEKGDVILYRSKKKGETAAAFNKLAEGLVICAFAPGGVTIFGLHFEAKHEGGA